MRACKHDEFAVRIERDTAMVCTACGLVLCSTPLVRTEFRDGADSIAEHDHRRTCPRTKLDDQTEKIGSLLGATRHVIDTSKTIMVRVNGKPSNVSLLAAVFYVAFRQHNLDRLEEEIFERLTAGLATGRQVATGLSKSKFTKALRMLRSHDIDDAREPHVSLILRRLVATRIGVLGKTRTEVACATNRAESLYTHLWKVYGDVKTMATVVQMTITHLERGCTDDIIGATG